MTRVYLGLLCAAAAILLFAPTQIECRNVTNEDIRDAILSLVHMFRTSEDKLERHEYREKVLGDQLKRMLGGLEKKHRALEPLKGMISRLDERLSNVETILMQKEEREKSVQQKTNDALEAIQKSLQTLTSEATNPVQAGAESKEVKSVGDNLTQRLDQYDVKLDLIKREVDNLKNSLSKESLRGLCLEVGSDGNPLEKHISEAEKLLNKYELKLSEYNGNTSRVQTDFVPLNEISLADEAWHSKMTEVMEKQEQEVKKIQRLLSDAESTWKELARASDIKWAINQTLTAIDEAKDNITANGASEVSKVAQKLRDMNDRLLATNEDIQRSLTEGNTMTERLFGDISRSYDSLHTNVQTLSKNEHILLQTADNVIANKKRIEYGVHQILLEVGELVKTQGKKLNRTITDRFDNIETSIVEKQTGALSNLSSKIESEMSQVWRQIGIMYQQLTASKSVLDKLTEQTEQYVNTSANTMGNMKDKVGQITTTMSEVDDNLNYLLGRLSLVTEEFNRIKTGLGDALDKVKTSFLAVQTKLEDASQNQNKINSSGNVTIESQ